MKGQLVIKFDVPNKGLVTNVPPHLVGTDALIDGSNVFVDLDGRMKTRLGNSQVGSTLSPVERVLGIGSYEDNTGTFFPTVGTATRWQAQIAGAWTDISGGSLLTGTINDPVRFTTISYNNKNWLLGANNTNQIHQWNSSLAAYQNIAASPIARDILTLNNRIVAFNTVEGGVRYPFRVRWSSTNDPTTWPSLSFADLSDSGCSIVGAALTSRISAVIYRQYAGWLIQAVPGGDATCFNFDRIPSGDHMTGPTSSASIVIAEGKHYYFGVDGRIYQYDGLTISPISDPIDPVIRGLYNNAEPTRFSSTFVPAYRQLCFFFASGGNTDPNACIVFDLRRGVFEPLWTFPINITASSEVREQTGPNWLNWVSISDTWLTIPWSSWASIPAGNQLSAYTGDNNGNVYRFMTSNQDGTSPIPYSATWGLQRGLDEFSTYLVHYSEIYLEQSLTDDTIVASLMGYLAPLLTGTQIDSFTIITSDSSTYRKTSSPGPANAANIKSNLIQLVLNSSGSFGQMAFGGSVLLIDYDLRGDYSGNGPQ